MKRAFADLDSRQVHYRHAGDGGVPLLMLHAAPGGSKQLESLARGLAADRRVVASDRPGAGDSPALLASEPSIADFAVAELALIDWFGWADFDLYGAHTGAAVAVELALLAPSRVRRVVLDGISLFDADQAAHFARHYAPRQAPDLAGTHLAWVFQFYRDQALFFPWFEPTTANARGVGLPTAEALHEGVLEVLKSLATYHQSYQAAFRYEVRARLPLLTQQVLVMAAEDDPLRVHLTAAAALVPNATLRTVGALRVPGTAALRATVIAKFLA